MKVWILHHTDYGDISVWDASVNPLDIPMVKDELEHVDSEELEDFTICVSSAIRRGHGHAYIEERFEMELTEVRSLLQ